MTSSYRPSLLFFLHVDCSYQAHRQIFIARLRCRERKPRPTKQANPNRQPSLPSSTRASTSSFASIVYSLFLRFLLSSTQSQTTGDCSPAVALSRHIFKKKYYCRHALHDTIITITSFGSTAQDVTTYQALLSDMAKKATIELTDA